MNAAHRRVVIGCGLLCWTIAGGASVPRGIPTGEWTGRGTYVDYEAVATIGSDAPPTTRSKDGVYDTTLKITRQTLLGHDSVVIDICSKRGELLNMDDSQTRIGMVLAPTAKLPNGGELYAVVNWQYDKGPNTNLTKTEFDKGLRNVHATYARSGKSSVLQLYYIVPSKKDQAEFHDTFLFEGNRVRKIGSVAGLQEPESTGGPKSEKLQAVYWVEELHRTR